MRWLRRLLGSHKAPEREAPAKNPANVVAQFAPKQFGGAADKEREDDLARLGTSQARRDEFLDAIVARGVWILAEGVTPPVDATGPEVVLDHIRQELTAMKQSQIGDPFTYMEKGSTIIPLFSSMEVAGRFIQTLPLKKATAFQCLRVDATFFLTNDFAVTRPILNPRTRNATELMEGDLRRIRAKIAKC